MSKPSLCPVCQAAAIRRVVSACRLPVPAWQCRGCGFVFCFPAPVVDSPPAGDDTGGLPQITAGKRRSYHRLADARYRHYAYSLGRQSFRLLEIGCGSCGLAERFGQLGVEYYGIDRDRRVVAAARAAGVRNIRHADFLDLPGDERYDVITFSQVLEHITEPRQFLAKVHSMLAPGGVLHCDVPNHRSLPSVLYRLPLSRTRWGALVCPHHVFAYTRRSLRAVYSTDGSER